MSGTYRCTDCGGDATVAFTDVRGAGGQIIGRDERLCVRRSRKRGMPDFFHAPITGRPPNRSDTE